VEGDLICLHAGPYGTADAVAHRNGEPMRFPDIEEGHRYLEGTAPGPDDDQHHDIVVMDDFLYGEPQPLP